MRRLLYILMCLTCSMLARAQSTYQYRYWFDGDDSNAKTVTADASLHLDVELAGLSEALHSLHLQVVNGEGVPSSPHIRYFLKSQASSECSLRYWFDSDDANQKFITGANATADIDVSNLSDGLHILHVQKTGNTQSQVKTAYFLKIPQVKGVDKLKCVTSIDGAIYKQEDVPSNDGLIHYDLDVTGLSEGVHHLSVQFVTNSGAASSVSNSYFLRANTTEEISNMKCFYSIDGEAGKALPGSYNSGAFHFDLDVVDVPNGLHRISYLLVTESGATTSMRNAFFWKTPLGGNGLSSYDYWLNDDYEGRTSVQFAEHQTSYNLISMLPVASKPLRSSDFHFEYKDGKPMIYAQNDFHLRFNEASGRWVDECASFTDYNVSQEVTGAELLESGIPVEKAKPAENEIQWYHFPAQIGDSLCFKVDRACTVQVFAPSGKEVYKASGAEVVNWDGCHAWENGEYYLALHDVTAQQGTETKLEYLHIDKYAVLAHDVHRVGNGGMSTITFNGNGFKNLYAVELINGGTTINHIDIGHESDATTTVSFDFEDAPLGLYKAVFHFVDEDRICDNMLEVEEQKEIKLDATISYPSTFLRGSSTTYTVNITNEGNSTAYVVPIELKLIVNSINNIQDIKFSGDIKSLAEPDLSLIDSLEQEDIDMVKEIFKKANDLSQFVVYHDSISGKDYGISHLTINIAPYSTAKFSVTVKSTDVVNLYAYTSAEWFPLHINNQNQRKALKVKSRTAQESLCCMKDRIECGADIIATIIGLNPAWGCASSIASSSFSMAFDIWCSEGNSAMEKFDNYLKNLDGSSVAQQLIDMAVSCITSYYSKMLKSLRADYSIAYKMGHKAEMDRIALEILNCKSAWKSAISSVYGYLTSAIVGKNCGKAFSEVKPNCPPIPIPGGGDSTPVNSLDPNEITGYTAESGSLFVKKDLVDVNYKIEFENDPEFATASAHKVVVTDALDKNLFDLTTFAPTSVKVGEKMVELDGTPNFVKTIDMRPEIDAIVQVEGKLDQAKSIATWTFTSLDPMTMEPTYDVMQGFLPVNFDGRGMGEVTFDIKLKPGLADGTEIPNKADIVFDFEEPIVTPTWTNTIDAVAPTSTITSCEMKSDNKVTLEFEGNDERSGIWKYDLYVQQGNGSAWIKAAEDITENVYSYECAPGLNYGFCVVATDNAGNVEEKELQREASVATYTVGDANGDGVVNSLDMTLAIEKYLGKPVAINFEAADVNGDGIINSLDATQICEIYLSASMAKRNQIKRTRKRINHE